MHISEPTLRNQYMKGSFAKRIESFHHTCSLAIFHQVLLSAILQAGGRLNAGCPRKNQ